MFSCYVSVCISKCHVGVCSIFRYHKVDATLSICFHATLAIGMFSGWKCYEMLRYRYVFRVEMPRYRYVSVSFQGGNATLSICFQGGNATLSLCFQGGNAMLSVCYQGGNATLSVCFQGGSRYSSIWQHKERNQENLYGKNSGIAIKIQQRMECFSFEIQRNNRQKRCRWTWIKGRSGSDSSKQTEKRMSFSCRRQPSISECRQIFEDTEPQRCLPP